MPLRSHSRKMLGQTRVKKQLATQSVFYGGVDNGDLQQQQDRQHFRKQSLGSSSFLMHNPSEVSLGKGSLRMGETTVNSKVSVLRRTRQSTKLSQDSIGHRPNSSIEDVNGHMMGTIMNIETNNQSITTELCGNLLKNKGVRNSLTIRQGSKNSMKSGAPTNMTSKTNQIFIQSNDYQQNQSSKGAQPRRSRPLTSMTKHRKKMSSSMGYRPLTGNKEGRSPNSVKKINTRSIAVTMTEAQIKSTVSNLQTMLGRLPSNAKSNKNYL